MSVYLQFFSTLLVGGILLMLVEQSRIKAKQKYKSTIFGAVTKPLTRVHLKPMHSPGWITGDQAKSIIDDFTSKGFEAGKSYVIHELNDLLLHSLFLGDFAAVVVKHPVEGIWSEVFYRRDNGQLFMATNSLIGNELFSHDDNIKFYERNAAPIGLYNLLKTETTNMFANSITDENFKEVIEEYYRREICWKNNKGGITIHDFKDNIKSADCELKITKEDLRKIFLEMKVDELHHWHDACIEEYRKETRQTGRKFDHLEYALFIVPQKTISSAYLEYLADYNFLDDAVKQKLEEAFRKKTHMQKVFELINNALPSERQARYVGEVAHPLNAQLYHRGGKN